MVGNNHQFRKSLERHKLARDFFDSGGLLVRFRHFRMHQICLSMRILSVGILCLYKDGLGSLEPLILFLVKSTHQDLAFVIAYQRQVL